MMLYIVISEGGYVHCVFDSRREADGWLVEYINRTPATRTIFRVIERPLNNDRFAVGY